MLEGPGRFTRDGSTGRLPTSPPLSPAARRDRQRAGSVHLFRIAASPGMGARVDDAAPSRAARPPPV